MTRSTMRPDGPNFPGFPRPYPHIPPEVPPGTPPPPAIQPPVPTVWMPHDDLRSQVYDQLLARRTVFVERALDTETASFVVAQLMTLDGDGHSDDDAPPVSLVVNSPGGPLDAAAMVLDTVDLMRCPVDTTCIGQAIGTAAVVVAAGTGTRRAGMSARFRLRLADVDLTGSANQLRDEVAQLNHLQGLLVDRLATVTGQERRLVERDVEQGRTLSADEALTYGLVDEIVQRRH